MASGANQPFGTLAYAKDVFINSLLTGVPQILQAENVGRKLIKTLVLMLCLTGFVYQTSQFMHIFYRYPTVLDIDVEYPEVIESPAITYCNLNGIKRTSFCDKFPEYCASPADENKFCETYPAICKRHLKRGRLDVRFPSEGGLSFERSATVENLKEMGHLGRNILQHCMRISMDGEELVQCSWDNLIHSAMDDGYTGYRNCYTLYSSFNSTKLKQHRLPVPKKKNALFHMVFEMEPDQSFRPDRQIGVILAIHSPDTVVNPFYDGVVIQPGHLYSVHLKVVEEKLLPHPYETKCTDYSVFWEARGHKGPLSQEMCIGECVYNASMKLCNCVIPNIMYYHNDTICKEDELDCFDYNITQCYEYCQQPCDFTNFEYDVQQRKLEDITANTIDDFYESDSITDHQAVVLLFLKRPEIIVYNHRPQYEDIEVFSFMGGYVGMWLGVSLIAVFDFLENVTLVSYFWIQRRLKIK